MELPTESKRTKIITERLKQWAIVVGIFISIITSVSAHFKEEEETKAKNSYKELSSAIEKVSKDQIVIYKDLSSIRGYLAGKHANKKDLAMDNEKILELLKIVKGPAKINSNSISGKPVTIKIEPLDKFKESDLPKIKSDPKQYKAPPVEAL